MAPTIGQAHRQESATFVLSGLPQRLESLLSSFAKKRHSGESAPDFLLTLRERR